MRAAVVIELHGSCHLGSHLSHTCEDLSFEQFVLHRVVYPFRLGIVLGVATFRHTDSDIVPCQCVDILTTGVFPFRVNFFQDKTR